MSKLPWTNEFVNKIEEFIEWKVYQFENRKNSTSKVDDIKRDLIKFIEKEMFATCPTEPEPSLKAYSAKPNFSTGNGLSD